MSVLLNGLDKHRPVATATALFVTLRPAGSFLEQGEQWFAMSVANDDIINDVFQSETNLGHGTKGLFWLLLAQRQARLVCRMNMMRRSSSNGKILVSSVVKVSNCLVRPARHKVLPAVTVSHKQ